MVQLLLIALSLALDALAVSVSTGIANPGGGVKQAVRLGAWFGVFQFAMPLIGFLLGQTLASYIERAAPWIAFGLLALIGGHMIWDALRPGDKKEDDNDYAHLSTGRVCLLAIATSIDALAVGVSAAFMAMPLLLSCVVIGVTAFVLSFLGAMLGKRLGSAFQTYAQLVGGLVLIGIGVKFILQRFFF